MQYLIKDLMVSAANIIIGAFLGIILSIGNSWMNGLEQPLLGCVLFYGSIIVAFVYCVLLKKFVMGEELSIVFPAICMLVGLWIGFNCNAYV